MTSDVDNASDGSDDGDEAQDDAQLSDDQRRSKETPEAQDPAFPVDGLDGYLS